MPPLTTWSSSSAPVRQDAASELVANESNGIETYTIVQAEEEIIETEPTVDVKQEPSLPVDPGEDVVTPTATVTYTEADVRQRVEKLCSLAATHGVEFAKTAAYFAVVAAMETLRRCLICAEAVTVHTAAKVTVALEDLLESNLLKLRHGEAVDVDLESTAGTLRERLACVLNELGRLPLPSALAMSVVALQLAVAARDIANTVVLELFYGKTAAARLALLGLVSPGYVLMHQFREELSDCVIEERAWREAKKDPANWPKRLVEHARAFPPTFWLAVSISGAFTVRAASDLCCAALRRILSIRFRGLVKCALAFGAVSTLSAIGGGYGGFAAELPPEMARWWATVWYRVQAYSRNASIRFKLDSVDVWLHDLLLRFSTAFAAAASTRRERLASSRISHEKGRLCAVAAGESCTADMGPATSPLCASPSFEASLPIDPPLFHGNSAGTADVD